MGQIKQKVDKRIADSNINPEYVGLALGLVLGGPANLVKSVAVDQFFGDDFAVITDQAKTIGAAYLLNTDSEIVENTLNNKELINQTGNETAKQLLNQIEWTKEGVGIASSIVLGAADGAVVGKPNTINDGNEVEVSTAGGFDLNGNKSNQGLPESVTRNDQDFYSTTNHRGDPKAYINEKGDLVPPNIDGNASISTHIRGGNSDKTPYISTTDPRYSQEP